MSTDPGDHPHTPPLAPKVPNYTAPGFTHRSPTPPHPHTAAPGPQVPTLPALSTQTLTLPHKFSAPQTQTLTLTLTINLPPNQPSGKVSTLPADKSHKAPGPQP